MTQYPRDEFDVVPENARREGSHRSFVRLRDPRTGIWTLIVIGLLALAVGAVMFFVVHPKVETVAGDADSGTSQSEDSGDEAKSSDKAGSSDQAKSTDKAKDGGEGEAKKSDEASAPASSGASESASSSPSSSSSDSADLSATVGVYNGTGRSGLASGSASTLKSAGYTNVSNANWTKRTSVSAVYYKDAASKATAEAIAKRLKISTVVQTANIPSPVSVVIGTDRSN